MMEANGDLDEPLVELPVGAAVVGPELFPDFVRFEEVADVEVLDAFQIPRVVGFVGHGTAHLVVSKLWNSPVASLTTVSACRMFPAIESAIAARKRSTSSRSPSATRCTRPLGRLR